MFLASVVKYCKLNKSRKHENVWYEYAAVLSLSLCMPWDVPHMVKTRFHCWLSASLPGYPTSITVGNAIKNRASNEEIMTILKEVPNPNQEDDDGQFPASLVQDISHLFWEVLETPQYNFVIMLLYSMILLWFCYIFLGLFFSFVVCWTSQELRLTRQWALSTIYWTQRAADLWFYFKNLSWYYITMQGVTVLLYITLMSSWRTM